MEMIRTDVWLAVGDALYFADKTDDEFHGNVMLFTKSDPVELAPL